VLKNSHNIHGVGAKRAAAQIAMHVPSPALQAIIAAGTPTPAVTVPNVKPAAYLKVRNQLIEVKMLILTA
jgi:hypothetical protein